MADNVAITAGTGTTVASDDIAGVHYPRAKISLGADGSATDAVGGAGAVSAAVQRTTLASDDPAVVSLAIMDDWDESDRAKVNPIVGQAGVAAGAGAVGATVQRTTLASDDPAVTSLAILDDWDDTDAAKTVTPFNGAVDATVTRPADTNAYAANDAWSDSTSAPTSGGFTFTNAARKSGGSGLITGAIITSTNDPATLLQGEIWIFDQAVTNINDNVAFTISDGEVVTLIGVIPFVMQSTAGGSGANSYAHVSGLNFGFTCVGSANLRFLVKVKNAYTPASAEALKVRLKIIQL